MACHDIYVLAQPCGPVLYVYPPQLHPRPPSGSGSGGGMPPHRIAVTNNRQTVAEPDREPNLDDELALLLVMDVL